MTTLLTLWSSVIPSVALPLPYSGLMSLATSVLLILCAAALWLERDRSTALLPKPALFGDTERLAA